MKRSPSLAERIGNALAFALILTILGYGGYSILAIVRGESTFLAFGGSEVVRPSPVMIIRAPTLTPFERLMPPESPTPVFVQPTPAPPSPTPEPQLPTEAPPTDTPLPSATATLPPSATPEPPTATPPPPTETPVPTEIPLPTPEPPTPTPAFAFVISAAGPNFERGCDATYIFGFVRDGASNPLPGLRVRVYSEFGTEIAPATTKSDPPGWYDVLIARDRATWYVQVVDASNTALSPPASVFNTGNFVPGSEACWHQVDFARAN